MLKIGALGDRPQQFSRLSDYSWPLIADGKIIFFGIDPWTSFMCPLSAVLTLLNLTALLLRTTRSEGTNQAPIAILW